MTFVMQIVWKNFWRVNKLPQTNKLSGNQIKPFNCFVVISTARFP